EVRVTMTVLSRIKAALWAGRFDFSAKARLEMLADELSEQAIVESILRTTRIHKTIRSTSGARRGGTEYLHVIIIIDPRCDLIYAKGKLTRYAAVEKYYFLVSAKRSD